MITIKEYVLGLFEDIPDTREKDDIVQELILNLEEKVSDLMESGKMEEDAINKAIVDLGDVSELKNSLVPASYKQEEAKKINYSNRMWFSFFGAALTISMFAFTNLYFSPGTIWFVYPAFAILWWPLSMVFSYLNNKGSKKS